MARVDIKIPHSFQHIWLVIPQSEGENEVSFH